MMSIGIEAAERLGWWTYTALLSTWNDRHNSDDNQEPVEAPDPDYFLKRGEVLAARGFTGSVH